MQRLRNVSLLMLVMLGLLIGLIPANAHSKINQSGQGKIIDIFNADAYSKARINAIFDGIGLSQLTPVKHSIHIYGIEYTAIDYTGKLGLQSAMFAVPDGAKSPLPLAEYFHGTDTLRSDVPSNPIDFEGRLVALLYAADGYAVVAPDFYGFGVSDGTPFFEQKATCAASGYAALLAAKAMTKVIYPHYSLNGQTFLTGYSLGGYAALAVQEDLQARHAAEFPVSASAPAAGAYDLSNTTLKTAFLAPAPETPAEVAALIYGYHQLYPGLYGALTDAFTPAVASILPGLLDGTHSLDYVASKLPDTVIGELQPGFVNSVETDHNAELNVALRENNVYRFAPTSPTLLIYAGGDKTVSPLNTKVAITWFATHGSHSFAAFNVGDNYDHNTGAVPSILTAKRYFDLFRSK